jgi:hypothetical protein
LVALRQLKIMISIAEDPFKKVKQNTSQQLAMTTAYNGGKSALDTSLVLCVYRGRRDYHQLLLISAEVEFHVNE